jgi:malate dehydrogenase (oxaloacetate-decarboxylating)
MANPEPEVRPEAVMGSVVQVMATGRSDYPNQINNVLAFPGVFKGALSVYASTINEAMEIAAARAIASVITEDELSEEYVIPSVFNKAVVEVVSAAVAEAAVTAGVARKSSTLAADVAAIYR